MTKEKFAALLNGREIGNEISSEESELAKAHGLVVIYGASDDLTEFTGAIHDEYGAYDSTTHKLDRKGVLPDRDTIDDDEELKDFFKREPKAATIDALWCKEGDYSWTFKTKIPHATFEIVEDGKPYCRGIVIKLESLPKA